MVKTILRSPLASVALLVAGAVLLLGGSAGAVWAAPQAVSGDYRAEVELASIGTALVENGEVVEGDDVLLGGIAAEGEAFKVGKTYDEALAVRNTGSIDEYVRVTLTKYWADARGKAVDLDPALIQLRLPQGSGWEVDSAASTPERTVLYYSKPLAPGEDTPLFADALTVDGQVVTSVSKLADGSSEFDYEGVQFRVKAVADAVQTHNGDAAMTSAWGRTLSSGGDAR